MTRDTFKSLTTALVIGLLFGLGIIVAGMGNPAKVINFFDLAGTWDPSLAFVMAGALAVTVPGYRLVLGRPRPLLDGRFHLPTAKAVDLPLVAGSAVFGIGWGIAGYCPGGVLPMLASGHAGPLVFTIALVAGQIAARWVRSLLAARPAPGRA